MAPPLFIVGTSRSGTSWAFELCASHPGMSMGYESKLPIEGSSLYKRTSETLDDRRGFGRFVDALRSEVDDPMNQTLVENLGDPEVIDGVFEAHRMDPSWATACEMMFRSIEGTSHWGNKFLRVELTPQILGEWPEARFIVLTRDPRGVMASQSKKFEHSLEYSALYWNTHARFVARLLAGTSTLPRDRFRVVDLVEMARDPSPTLEWAFSSVGLTLDPIPGLIKRFPGDPDRLDAWRNTLAADSQLRIESYCFDGMQALGYGAELATAQKDLGRGRRLIAMAREHGSEILRDPGSIRRKQITKRVRSALGR